MPSRSSCGADLRAAAVHDDGLQAGVAQEHDVLGEGAPSARSSIMALPPNLMTTVLPWCRVSQGSASMRICALGSAVCLLRQSLMSEYALFSWT